MSKPVRIESMRSLRGAPPDRQIIDMVKIQDALYRAFSEVRPTDALMNRCHEAMVLAGMTAQKD